MAMFDGIPAIDALLNCAICMESFQYPKRLNCDHSFCQSCLESYIPATARVITCPTCRSKTLKPDNGISELPHDFRVGQIRDGLAAISTSSGPRHNCGICKSKPATVSCLDCSKFMCGSCLDQHNLREAIAAHAVIKVSDLQSCGDHGEHCSHVCQDCEKLVCVTCTQDDCAEHQVTHVGEAARKQVGCGNHQERIKKTRKEYTALKNTHMAHFSDVEKQIRETTNKLCRMLREDETQMLHYLKTLKESTASELEATRIQEEEKILKVAQTNVKSVNDLKRGIPGPLLECLPILEALGKKKQESKIVNFTPKFQPDYKISIGELGNPSQEIKRVFRFEKVVLVQRGHVTTLLAKHGDIIVRNDFNGPDENQLKLYRKDMDREFQMDAQQVAKLPIIFSQNWKPYLPNIREMTYKIKNYAQQNNIQLNEIVMKSSKDGKRSCSQPRNRARKPSGTRVPKESALQ